MKHIVLTGGGTAGHVTPNIALIPTLKAAGYQISYIGSYEGIERKLIEEMGIPYYGISSGKLRRYFDPKNFSDPFRVLKGFHEAKKLLKKLKPDVVFSKGGFVTVPVVIAAKKCKIPAIIHESDMTPGLANKLCIPSAVKVCCNFPETVSSLPADKAVLTGTPIRQELLKGDKEAGRQFCGFTSDKPVLMVIGGSLGAASVNDHVRKILPELLKEFQVIHLCGKGKMDESLNGTEGYVQYEYIKEELPDLFALSDVVISRAGANAICEISALHKPNLLIPLSAWYLKRRKSLMKSSSIPSISYTKTATHSKKQWQVANRWIPFIISFLLLRNVYYPGKQQKAVTNVTAFLVSPVLL